MSALELPITGIQVPILVPIQKPSSRTIYTDFAAASRHYRYVSGSPEYELLV